MSAYTGLPGDDSRGATATTAAGTDTGSGDARTTSARPSTGQIAAPAVAGKRPGPAAGRRDAAVTARVLARRVLGIVCSAVMLAATGCSFNGVNSLPLPGAVGRGPGADIYHVEIANVGTLESNSPVLINDVMVGSVGKMTVHAWHADVEISVKPDVVVPANAVASRRPDQPAGIDAPGTQSAARPAGQLDDSSRARRSR